MAEKSLKNQFLAGRPLFFAWQTVFLFHQIKHWVDIHLWANGFFCEIGPSAGNFFLKVQKLAFFQFLAGRPLFFAWQTVFLFHQIKHWVDIHLWAKGFYGEIGPSAGKFFLKVPKLAFFQFLAIRPLFFAWQPVFYSIKSSIGFIYIFGQKVVLVK